MVSLLITLIFILLSFTVVGVNISQDGLSTDPQLSRDRARAIAGKVVVYHEAASDWLRDGDRGNGGISGGDLKPYYPARDPSAPGQSTLKFTYDDDLVTQQVTDNGVTGPDGELVTWVIPSELRSGRAIAALHEASDGSVRVGYYESDTDAIIIGETPGDAQVQWSSPPEYLSDNRRQNHAEWESEVVPNDDRVGYPDGVPAPPDGSLVLYSNIPAHD